MKILRNSCMFVAFLSLVLPLSAQTFNTLHNFEGPDGYNPVRGLVQATNGDLYGTTSLGGTNGYGTVFKITPTGTLTTLYNFCSQTDCADGAEPNTTLIQASNGDFYGTTLGGGTNGYGTIFKITPGGTLTTLYRFCLQNYCPDGYSPEAGLVQASNGFLYGTTYYGGANHDGTIFKIDTGGTLTTLHAFDGTDGNNPSQGAGLIQATDGNLYGITEYGGANALGTAFKITLSGTLTSLYSFCPVVNQNGYCTDGQRPEGGLVQASNGDFYGTAPVGGTYDNGTVFKITSSGALTTLYNFCSQSGCTDGTPPGAELIQATDGNLYGTTDSEGAFGEGTIFKITPAGTLTTVYSFGTDGANPGLAGLIQDTNGSFYGVTEYGGEFLSVCPSGCGTVFSLSIGLHPFVETQPTSGAVGAAVKILGTGLTGATSVTFNGTVATFHVVSSSEITTTVPAGATTGKVKVITPHRTLTSNVSFRVTP